MESQAGGVPWVSFSLSLWNRELNCGAKCSLLVDSHSVDKQDKEVEGGASDNGVREKDDKWRGETENEKGGQIVTQKKKKKKMRWTLKEHIKRDRDKLKLKKFKVKKMMRLVNEKRRKTGGVRWKVKCMKEKLDKRARERNEKTRRQKGEGWQKRSLRTWW